jgi:peptide/nickel transport system ATP-binding protein/oligopeptide transport system ATP-binding protein
MAKPLLEVKNVVVQFPRERRSGDRVYVRAVDRVSLQIFQGDAFGLVGESGCGKTTLGKTIVGLLNPSRGQILFNGEPLLPGRYRPQDMQMVFQDPYAALNPRMTVRSLVQEGLRIQRVGETEIRERVLEILAAVGLAREHLLNCPHEFSGGQRQRISLARALVLRPKLLVLDEPLSALDVSVQAQLLYLLHDLKKKYNLSYLMISHNLAVIRQLCRHVAVMYMGRIVETGHVDRVFSNPRHYYTRMLLDASQPTDPFLPPGGCRFHPRCLQAKLKCRTVPPVLAEAVPGHYTACHLLQR